MKRRFVSVLTGLALAVGASQAAAQAVCQLDGTANVETGTIDEDPNLGTGSFTFSGALSAGPGCDGLTVCAAPAAIENASCAANTHSGTYVVCNGECAITCGGEDCDDASQGDGVACDDPVQEGEFQGVCIGALCPGGDLALPDQGSLYVLAFDQATIETALAVCNDPTTEPDSSIDEASFTGLFAFTGPGGVAVPAP